MENFNRYKLINYFDVWGNSKDGWEVNDQHVEFDDLHISNNTTDKEILKYLKKIKFLTTDDMRQLVINNYGDIIEIYERKSMRPLCALLPLYE
jgi:hypothetical protein